MRQYQAADIRNIALAGHGGAGKTAFVEAALQATGVVDRMGRSDEGTAAMDFDAEEMRRGMTINLSYAAIEWKDKKINLLDTPGDFDFLGEQIQGFRVSDAVLIVMSGKDGLAVGVEKAVRQAGKQKRPVSFFVNRLDEPHASFDQTLAALQEAYGSKVVPLALPIVEGEDVLGLVDVIGRQAFKFAAKGKMEKMDVPAALADRMAEYYDQLQEQIAECDEDLMMKYFEGEPFTAEEQNYGLRQAILTGSIWPVFAGAAQSNLGVTFALDAIADYLPSPLDTPPVLSSFHGEEQEIAIDPDSNLAAYIFKTIVDPFVGKISLFKVYQGVFPSTGTVYNSSKELDERVNGLSYLIGKKQIPADSGIVAGDIGSVTKLGDSTTNDTLCERSHKVRIVPPVMPRASLTLAILPVTKGEEDKIVQGLTRLADEDTVFTIENNPETKQLLLSGLGEIQLDVLTNKLKNKYNVESTLEEPRVAYRETIRKQVRVQGRHKKQTGGHGQFGDVWIVFEPSESDGLEFEEQIVGGVVPKGYFPAVEKGLLEAIEEGPLANYPVVGLKATLVDGSYHAVDSNEMSFKLAARLAYRAGMPQANPVLLEPISKLSVHIPDDYLGDVMGDMNKRRGRILGINPDPEELGYQIVEAEAPTSEILRYSTDLKSMTQGRGWYNIEFARYEQAPQPVADKIIAEAQREEEE
ncbi:MAG: elongation factor G [Clostridiaceae bacterium]|jgi:elongation factor G|nr:elongation factor G [Clostridiaceae bacterium]